MRRFRFSIAHLLLFVLICGLGFAALRRPSQLWAGAWFSAAVAALTAAVLAAVYRHGSRRAFWVGFACCGWIYWLLALAPWTASQTSPLLITTAALDLLFPHLAPLPPGPPPTIVIGPPTIVNPAMPPGMPGAPNTGSAPGAGGMGNLPMPLPNTWQHWADPDVDTGVGTVAGSIYLVSSEPFRRIGHSQFTLLVALLGGGLARRLRITEHDRSDETHAGQASRESPR